MIITDEIFAKTDTVRQQTTRSSYPANVRMLSDSEHLLNEVDVKVQAVDGFVKKATEARERLQSSKADIFKAHKTVNDVTKEFRGYISRSIIASASNESDNKLLWAIDYQLDALDGLVKIAAPTQENLSAAKVKIDSARSALLDSNQTAQNAIDDAKNFLGSPNEYTVVELSDDEYVPGLEAINDENNLNKNNVNGQDNNDDAATSSSAATIVLTPTKEDHVVDVGTSSKYNFRVDRKKRSTACGCCSDSNMGSHIEHYSKVFMGEKESKEQFGRNARLDMRRQSPENPSKYRMRQQQNVSKCLICKALLPNKTVLLGHVEMVHEDAKRFECFLCGYWTLRLSDLRGKHMAIHTGTKKFECMYCTMKFIQAVDLNKHIKRKHCSAE